MVKGHQIHAADSINHVWLIPAPRLPILWSVPDLSGETDRDAGESAASNNGVGEPS